MLRDYFDIAAEGDFRKLLISGSASLEQCKEQWNKIVSDNFESSGTMDYVAYLDNLDGYNSFLQEHNSTMCQLLILHFQIDDEIITELCEKGYNIDVSGKKAYTESLIVAMNRSKHLLSRIKLKENEIENFNEQLQDSKPATFDEVMASLIVNIGFTVPDDITLVRYNQYRKIIEARRKQQVTEV